MLRPTPMQHLNPAAFLADATSPSSRVRFFIPPPDSRAAFIQPKLQHAANASAITRTLGLLKPHFCKLSTYFQQTIRVDTLGAVAQSKPIASLISYCPRLSEGFALVDHANYGGMPRDTRRVSPTDRDERRLNPGAQRTLFKRGSVCL